MVCDCIETHRAKECNFGNSFKKIYSLNGDLTKREEEKTYNECRLRANKIHKWRSFEWQKNMDRIFILMKEKNGCGWDVWLTDVDCIREFVCWLLLSKSLFASVEINRGKFKSLRLFCAYIRHKLLQFWIDDGMCSEITNYGNKMKRIWKEELDGF